MSESEEQTALSPSIGSTLRARRKELGWTEQDVADHLRIRISLLQALECDDYKALPGQAYVVGFLKSYAGLLGLDSDRMVQSFRQLAEATQLQGLEKPELSFPQTVDDRALPKWLLITIGLAVVLAAYAGWYHFSSHDDEIQKSVNSSVLTEEKSSDVSTSSLLESPSAGSVSRNSETQGGDPSSDDTNPFSDGGAVPVQQDAVSSSPLSSPGRQDAAPKSPFEAPTPQPKVENSVVSSDQDAEAKELPPHVIELYFMKDSWTKITDQSGKIVDSKIFKAGETWRGDGSAAPYKVTAGNASGVILKAGNVVSAPLGPVGQVKRNVAISADAVLQGAFGHADSALLEQISSVKTGNNPLPTPKALEQSGGTH
ncbi:DUF4115 domain-containing protein [Acetobacteraceae bacterium ESL0709]|nr:DUF4115 domain-containing protein [Acetobacteraceae bacterium ESL0697]MDF7678285.1 DUF4115 domain-containing protein [Acetobacteraceae bacterium ESL0709]